MKDFNAFVERCRAEALRASSQEHTAVGPAKAALEPNGMSARLLVRNEPRAHELGREAIGRAIAGELSR